MSMGFSITPLVSHPLAADSDAEGNPKPRQHFHCLDRKPVQLLPATAQAMDASSVSINSSRLLKLTPRARNIAKPRVL